MKRLFKPHHQYDWRSESIILFKNKSIKIEMYEDFCAGHQIIVHFWKNKFRDNLCQFELCKWIHIPLNKEARLVRKCNKYQNKFDKTMEKLNKVIKENHDKQ